jgi:hypothetical protein
MTLQQLSPDPIRTDRGTGYALDRVRQNPH